ncbi:hypothetical protein [Pseudochrobactrum sp. HB0163]|uniref:hypothetical protein n=1 Tax=Pseudochrobactrum sp. HB0163 TaxID=3450708 RepID=UPI003F6DEE20
MYDGIPALWQKPNDDLQTHSDNAAYVFLGIFLAALAVPAAFILWAITTGLVAILS